MTLSVLGGNEGKNKKEETGNEMVSQICVAKELKYKLMFII